MNTCIHPLYFNVTLKSKYKLFLYFERGFILYFERKEPESQFSTESIYNVEILHLIIKHLGHN